MLWEDRIEFLRTIKNETKVRRSTRLLVLGKSKDSSYEDLKVARAKCVAEKSSQVAKGHGKCSRKSKNSLPEQEDDTPEIAGSRRKRKSAEPDGSEPTSKMLQASTMAEPVSALMKI